MRFRIVQENRRNSHFFEYDASNHREAVDQHFEHRIRLEDADICGDEFYIFIVDRPGRDDQKKFRLHYSWRFDEGPHWRIIDKHRIVEIPL